jgi:hypothetical protein
VLQDWSLLKIQFYGKTYIIAWLLMTISEDQSTHSESSVLQVSSMLNICLKNGYDCHNAGKDGDEKTDSPCDQHDYNVFTYHSDVELGQVKLNFLEGIQCSQKKLVWSNLEYKNCFDFHILSHVDSY